MLSPITFFPSIFLLSILTTVLSSSIQEITGHSLQRRNDPCGPETAQAGAPADTCHTSIAGPNFNNTPQIYGTYLDYDSQYPYNLHNASDGIPLNFTADCKFAVQLLCSTIADAEPLFWYWAYDGYRCRAGMYLPNSTFDENGGPGVPSPEQCQNIVLGPLLGYLQANVSNSTTLPPKINRASVNVPFGGIPEDETPQGKGRQIDPGYSSWILEAQNRTQF